VSSPTEFFLRDSTHFLAESDATPFVNLAEGGAADVRRPAGAGAELVATS
jgi:hypothetical protein